MKQERITILSVAQWQNIDKYASPGGGICMVLRGVFDNGRIGGSTNVLAIYGYIHDLPTFNKTRKSVCPRTIELVKKDGARTSDEIWKEDMDEANSLGEDSGVYWRGVRKAKIFMPN